MLQKQGFFSTLFLYRTQVKVNQNEKAEMIQDCMMAQGFRYTY